MRKKITVTINEAEFKGRPTIITKANIQAGNTSVYQKTNLGNLIVKLDDELTFDQLQLVACIQGVEDQVTSNTGALIEVEADLYKAPYKSESRKGEVYYAIKTNLGDEEDRVVKVFFLTPSNISKARRKDLLKYFTEPDPTFLPHDNVDPEEILEEENE